MSSPASFDLARTALLCMDCQAGIVSIYTKAKAEEFLARASGVVHSARDAGMQVIFIQVGFRPGLPEVHSRNKLFSGVKSSPEYQRLFSGPAAVIHPALGPEASDIVVTKHRVSAFTGTDLEMILRAGGYETLVLFGIATSGVVLSTLLEASDADFRLIVISDCCADLDASLHDALVTKFFPTRAEVITSAEFQSALAPNRER